ncbi:MAG: GNAT family N-acetyltransferase [Candidatus Poribacteria bacterium]|nr:GNAT family N-acetyltransferase [Candidatus Poribacteria bacterium]
MQNYGVRMIREHMNDIPEIPFPAGFGIRNYRPGEGHIWTRIQRRAEPFFEIEDGLFNREFCRDFQAMEDRSFFVVTDDGEAVGTITAWWQPNWRGGEWGQIHWVAIHPDYQGRGLSKPAMTVAMKRLKQSHERCFLGTSTGRIAAIKVYLDFGFCPDLESENSQEAWTAVASVLDRPILKACGF